MSEKINQIALKFVFFMFLVLKATRVQIQKSLQNRHFGVQNPYATWKIGRNLIESIRNPILFTIFRSIWNQTNDRLCSSSETSGSVWTESEKGSQLNRLFILIGTIARLLKFMTVNSRSRGYELGLQIWTFLLIIFVLNTFWLS